MSALEPQMPDWSEGDIVKRAVGESGLSDIKQSADIQECWALCGYSLARGCCHMTLWPPPAVWGSRDTSARLTKEEAGGKRSWAGCFINWSPLFELQTYLVLFLLAHIFLPSLSFCNVVFYLPLGKAFYSRWGLDSRSVAQCSTEELVQVKQNIDEENSRWLWSGFMVFSVFTHHHIETGNK